MAQAKPKLDAETEKELARIENTALRELPGAHLLKPLKDIKGSDQIRLLAVAGKIEEESATVGNAQTLELLADLADAVAKYGAKDVEAFEAWSGQNLNDTFTVCLKFVQELGKGENSTT